MQKIALVTNLDFPNLYQDDRLLLNHLAGQGFSLKIQVWDDKNTDWSAFDAIIIRSVWDYHLHKEAFEKWLDTLKALNMLVFNNVSVIKNNIHKSYLIDFQNKGLNCIPTVMIPRGATGSLIQIVASNGFNDVVLKPAVSLTAYNTFHIKKERIVDFENKFKELILNNDLLVQPFIQEIKDEGELSLIFFDKKFSHAVKKLPAPNDFRVQSDFGGTSESVEVPASTIQQAAAFLNQIEDPLLYARVDGVILNHTFYLMELELIDPVLFFGSSENAIHNFYEAFIKFA